MFRRTIANTILRQKYISKSDLYSNLTNPNLTNPNLTNSNVGQSRRSFITIVNQAEVAFREFLGSNRIRLEPGIHLNIPIIHQTRRVDMRERGINIKELHGYTKDNVPINVSGTLFFKIDDAEKSCFAIANYTNSVSAVGESSIRSIIGKFEYDTLTSERNKINAELRETIGGSIKDWGISCTRFEIQNMAPANNNVTEQLEAQMRAERARRENELNNIAKINTAEGEKRAQILKSEADLTSAQNRANAEKYAIEQNTLATVEQIERLKKSFPKLDENQILNYLLEKQRLENLNALANSDNKQIYFLNQTNMMPTQYGKIITDMLETKSNA